MKKYYLVMYLFFSIMFVFNVNPVFSQNIESEINALCQNLVSDDSSSVVNFRSNILKYDATVIPFILNNITDSLSDKHKFILMLAIIESSRENIIQNLTNIYNNNASITIKRMLIVSLLYLRLQYPSIQMEQLFRQEFDENKVSENDIKIAKMNPAWRLYYFIELPATLDNNKDIFKLFVELCEDKIRFQSGILMHEAETISSLVLANLITWCNDISFFTPTSSELKLEQMKNWWEDIKDRIYWASELKVYSVAK